MNQNHNTKIILAAGSIPDKGEDGIADGKVLAGGIKNMIPKNQKVCHCKVSQMVEMQRHVCMMAARSGDLAILATLWGKLNRDVANLTSPCVRPRQIFIIHLACAKLKDLVVESMSGSELPPVCLHWRPQYAALGKSLS